MGNFSNPLLGLGLGVAAQALPYPLINGYAFSYASAECKFNLPSGFVIKKGIKSVSYKAPREMAKQWGTHPEAYAITIGKQDYEAEIELYLAEAASIQRAIGPGFSDVTFDLHVTYSTTGVYPLIHDAIIGCRLTSPEQSFTSGEPAGLVRKYKLYPMSMLLDGFSMLSNPLYGNAS